MNGPGFTDTEGYAAARALTLIFSFAAILSYVYAISTGTYNGDFYGVQETLGLVRQTGMLIVALLPYGLAWQLYRYFKSRRRMRAIPVTRRGLTIIFFVVTLWFIALAVKYDVGVLGKEIYDAPGHIKPLIQFSNRVNPFYLGVLFILLHRGSRTILLLGIALLIALGLLRAGLGVFLYVSLALLVRHFEGLRGYVRRHKISILLAALAFPLLVAQLYSVRAALRDDGSAEIVMSATEIVAARLIGRLSSFSNSAVVVQETSLFRNEVQQLDPLYFASQAFGGVFGVAFIPRVTPERMLINMYGGDWFDVSFMVGVPGNLYLGWLVSPAVFLFNASLIVLMCVMVFVVTRQLNIACANEFALLLVLYPLTSGVGSEFSSLIASLVSFCVIFAVIRLISPPRDLGSRQSKLSGLPSPLEMPVEKRSFS